MIYIAFFAFVVVASAIIGALIVHLFSSHGQHVRQLVADVAAVEAAPVAARIVGGVDVTRPGLDPLPPMPAGWHDDSLGLVRQQAYATRDHAIVPELETAATTGDLSYIRQQLDLDDYALWMEQRFYELLEQTRRSFQAIQVTT